MADKNAEATDRIVKNMDITTKIVDSPDKVAERNAEATERRARTMERNWGDG
ncbi:hypothetical protein [Lysinibacillus xylanilyticus]|uniref:hypothetical protein n=1 Tax=Lysinibacillus xylanilyticus TaxID=582475 RepID=UPI003D0586C0